MGLLTLLAAAALLAAEPSRPAVEDFRLLDSEGLPRELRRTAASKAVVLIQRSRTCPGWKRAVPRLRRLAGRFAGRGAVVWLIDSGREGRKALARDAAADKLSLPVLDDDSTTISRALGFTKAPEAVVIDTRDWTMAYRGGLGGAEAALDALLAGGSGPLVESPEAGCELPYPKDPEGFAEAAAALKARCLNCHAPGGSLPPLGGYDAVRSWAPMIRETVRMRRMPSWPPDSQVRAIDGDLSLSAEERRVLLRWIETGLRRLPDEPDPLAGLKADPPERWPLGKPDRVLLTSKEQVYPANDPRYSPVEYVPLGPPLERDLWLRAIDLRSRNPRVKQHINLMALPEPFERFFAKHGQMRDGQLIMNTRLWHVFVTVRAPNERRPPVLPEGMAYHIPKGSHLVLELHYQSSGKEERDRIAAGFYEYRGSQPPRRVRMRMMGIGSWLRLPPGVQDYVMTQTDRFGKAVSLVGVFPHMHLRGVWIKLFAQYSDGKEEELFSAPDFDFFSASWYRFLEPKRLPADAKLILRASYDNSAANPYNPDPAKDIRMGWTLREEMFGVRMFYAE